MNGRWERPTPTLKTTQETNIRQKIVIQKGRQKFENLKTPGVLFPIKIETLKIKNILPISESLNLDLIHGIT